MAALPPQPAYVWNVEEPGQAVAYGVPDTDDRAIRLICSKHGRHWIASGPIDAEIGKTISVTMIGERSSRTFRSKVGEDGNGPNYTIDLKPDDDSGDEPR